MSTYEATMAELSALLLQLDQLQLLSLAHPGAPSGGVGEPACAIEIASLNQNGHEYRFWDAFLAMVNPRWHDDFRLRTANGEAYIAWLFIDGVTSPSKSLQYQEALRVARDVLRNSSALDSRLLGILEDLAQAVLRHRQRDHGGRDVNPNDPRWRVHELLVHIWQDLVETIARRRRDLN